MNAHTLAAETRTVAPELYEVIASVGRDGTHYSILHPMKVEIAARCALDAAVEAREYVPLDDRDLIPEAEFVVHHPATGRCWLTRPVNPDAELS